MRQRAIFIDTVKCRCGCGRTRKRFDSHGIERFYIKWHSAMIGRHHSLESRKKMSLRKRGKRLSKQHCEAISLGERTKRYFWSKERMKNQVYRKKR